MAAPPLRITDQDVKDAVAGALIRRRPRAGWIGWYQEIGDKAVERTATTVENWCYGKTNLDLVDFVRLCAYFGPAFADEVMTAATGLRVGLAAPANLNTANIRNLEEAALMLIAAIQECQDGDAKPEGGPHG